MSTHVGGKCEKTVYFLYSKFKKFKKRHNSSKETTIELDL